MFPYENKKSETTQQLQVSNYHYQEVLKPIHCMQICLWTALLGAAAGPHACIAPRPLNTSPLRLCFLQNSPQMLPEAVLSSLNEQWGSAHPQTPLTCYVDTTHSSAMLSLF